MPSDWTFRDDVLYGTLEFKVKALEAYMRNEEQLLDDGDSEPGAVLVPLRRHAHGCTACGIWWHDDPACVDGTLLACPAHRDELEG